MKRNYTEMSHPVKQDRPEKKMKTAYTCDPKLLPRVQQVTLRLVTVTPNGICISRWLSEGKPSRMRRLCLKTSEAFASEVLRHNLLIREGLRAYALTIPLLGFECTWYENLKSNLDIEI